MAPRHLHADHLQVLTGRIECGTLAPGDFVVTCPGGILSVVKSCEAHMLYIEKALPGYSMGICIKDLATCDVRRGVLLGSRESPPTLTQSFIANVIRCNCGLLLT